MEMVDVGRQTILLSFSLSWRERKSRFPFYSNCKLTIHVCNIHVCFLLYAKELYRLWKFLLVLRANCRKILQWTCTNGHFYNAQ